MNIINFFFKKNHIRKIKSTKDYRNATQKRAEFKNKVISVTGTNGKTNLSFLLNQTLSTKYITDKTWKNSNSTKGLPWCFNNHFNLESDYWICEIGISTKNEMKYLLDLVKPNIRIITNIGVAHSANFKNEKEYQLEKLSYLKKLPKNSVVIINNDDPILSKYKYPKKIQLIRCGSKSNSDVILDKIILDSQNLTSTISIKTNKGNINFKSKLLGKHMAETMCLVTGCALHLNVPIQNIKQVLENFTPYSERGGLLKKKNKTIFNYSYNANPNSMKANLDVFSQVKGKNKIIIIGDMLELNEKKEYLYHKNIYKQCLTITNNICIFTKNFKLVSHYENYPFLIRGNNLKDMIKKVSNFFSDKKQDYYIFIQGSNGTKINKITEII